MKTEKMIAKANKNIARKERTSTKLVNFFKTDKGEQMIKMIGHMPLTILIHHFQAPNLDCVGSYDAQMNTILTAVKKASREHLLPSKSNNLVDYTALANKENAYDAMRHRFIQNWQKNKSATKLTPYELKVMNKKDQWSMKKDASGKPIIKTAIMLGEKVNLYDKESGLPIYKWTPKPNPRGLAWKMHSYEEHKMAKYDKKMNIKMEIDKKMDLFPEQIVAKYKMLREAHLEQLRRDLVNLYNPASLTVIVKNDKTDNVTKIPIDATTRLGIIRGRKLLSGRTRQNFMSLSRSVLQDKPDSRVTCIHVNYSHCSDPGKVIIPELYGLAA